MPTRVLAVVGAAALVAVLAVVALRPAQGVPADAPSENEMARSIGGPVMEHLRRGHVTGRSAEIMTVPRPHNFIIGEWDLTTLGSDTPVMTTSHPQPWAFLARVPIIFYGPGLAPKGLEVRGQVDIAGLAPTYAELLGGVDGFEPDAPPFQEVLDAAGDRRPKVIFTVVMDGGGWNALQEHPDSWPNLAAMRREGTTYVDATIGSAPSITGALHATFGTGQYPIEHGIPGNQMRGPDGRNVDTYEQNADPRYLLSPTVSELYDEQHGNRPIVGTLSYEGWHLGMIGHGAQRDGGDRDIGVLWEVERNEFWTNENYYELPDYLQETDLDRLETYERRLDGRDGLVDAAWFGHSLEELQDPKIRPGTPAFVRFNGDAVADIIRREPFGEDALTDIFWVEMKMPDFAGHTWNVVNPEQADVLRETDRQIGRFRAMLDRKVGRGNYLFAVSADHGQQPLPETEGGWRINADELEADVEARFGEGLVEKVTPVDLYMDMDAVREADVALSDIAGYLGTYTLGDNIPDNAPGSEFVPEARLDERLFAGAFSTQYLQELTPERAEAFGEGDFPEGDFTIEAGFANES